MITERDIAILLAIVQYYVLNRMQIQRLCFPTDSSGRITRRRIQSLIDAKLLNRTPMQVVNFVGTAAPVYYPSRKGCEFLAEHFDAERYLAVPTQTPQTHHLFHWLSVSDTHIAFDVALLAQTAPKEIACDGWLNEWDTANTEENAPQKRYRIYTLIEEKPKLVCAPDAAFLLSIRGHRKVFYLEQDRNTSGVQQIAASKTPGYNALAERRLHKKHFPQTTLDVFTVLMVAPTERRRDSLRKAIAEKPGAGLWRFAASSDLTPERFLYEPVLYPCVGEPMPLVKPQAAGVVS